MDKLTATIRKEFSTRFTSNPIFVKSPGRVNLIGEHTDYNDGFVMPAAIDKYICFAIGLNGTNRMRFYSANKNEKYETNFSTGLRKSDKEWPNYLLGVADQLQKHGYSIGGFDCVFGGDVPIGAGLSSSAALEGGLLTGLATLFELNLSPLEMAKIAQQAENEFVGVQCGIMDQFAILNGKKNHVIKLDCRSLDYEYYLFKQGDIYIVLCDTQTRRDLANSAYNTRRSQCEKGVKILKQYDENIDSLRDVPESLLMHHRDKLNPAVFKRCKYVIEENQRVLKACRDLENNDLKSFGRRMFASHKGLKEEYEVSCAELDILVEEARAIEGVIGARMMGGGFGGCTINLIKDEHLEHFKKTIKAAYKKRTGMETKIYQTKISDGTRLIKNSIEESIM